MNETNHFAEAFGVISSAHVQPINWINSDKDISHFEVRIFIITFRHSSLPVNKIYIRKRTNTRNLVILLLKMQRNFKDIQTKINFLVQWILVTRKSVRQIVNGLSDYILLNSQAYFPGSNWNYFSLTFQGLTQIIWIR